MGGLPEGNDSGRVAFSSPFDPGRAPLFSHAMRIAGKVAHPISEFLTLDKVAGPAGEEGLAVLTLILISVAAGLLARTAWGRNLMRWSENSFLGGLPQYRLVKSVAEGLAQIENAEDLKPALVNIEDAWQIGLPA